MEELEAQLNEIEHALDNLESQNDNIHSKLKELLESNREIRKEMADLGMMKGAESANHSAENHTKGKLDAELQKINDLNLNGGTGETINKKTEETSSTSAKSKRK